MTATLTDGRIHTVQLIHLTCLASLEVQAVCFQLIFALWMLITVAAGVADGAVWCL